MSLLQSKAHFSQIPWCARILEQPGIITFAPASRAPEDAPLGQIPTGDQLFRSSLNTDNTIPHYIGFYNNPENDLHSNNLKPAKSGSQLEVTSSSLMMDLQPGVNGFNGSAHGGLIAALMDEAMGNLILVNCEHQNRQMEEKEGAVSPELLNLNHVKAFFTAGMDVKFKRPIPLPHVIVVTATVQEIQGRKLAMLVTIRGEDGTECASCDGLWLSIPKTRL